VGFLLPLTLFKMVYWSYAEAEAHTGTSVTPDAVPHADGVTVVVAVIVMAGVSFYSLWLLILF
jgi:hypothetical protein